MDIFDMMGWAKHNYVFAVIGKIVKALLDLKA